MKRIVAIGTILLVAALLGSSIGCKKSTLPFETIDGIEILSREDLHGRLGHLIGVWQFPTKEKDRSDESATVYLQIFDEDISDAPYIFQLHHTFQIKSASEIDRVVSLLARAQGIEMVSDLPKGQSLYAEIEERDVQQDTDDIANVAEVTHYLKVTANGEAYFIGMHIRYSDAVLAWFVKNLATPFGILTLRERKDGDYDGVRMPIATLPSAVRGDLTKSKTSTLSVREIIVEQIPAEKTEGALVFEGSARKPPVPEPPVLEPPTITAVSATSDNEDSATAIPGNTVTLTLTTDEPIVISQSQLTFTIADSTHASTLQAADTANQYTAQLQITDAMPSGALRASFTLEDAAGNRSSAIVKETTMTVSVPVVLPAVVSISYYRDRMLTKPFIDTVMEGDTVYTKVAFAKELPAGITDGTSAQPSIFSAVGSKEFQYRMQPQDTPEENFRSGDARPSQDSTAIICKYFVQREEVGETFLTYIGDGAVSGTPLQVLFFVYTDEIAIAAETITDWSPTDFTGQVYVPKNREPHGLHDRVVAQPLPNVIVTIMAGPRAGERTSTDSNGRYLFPDVAAGTLHLRVERARFEAKEVLVHRQHPTALANGDVPNFPEDPQRHPGNILIGQRWPDEVRFILRETLVVHDLLYIDGGTSPPDLYMAGYYGRGLVVAYSNQNTHPLARVSLLGTFAHEIAHAHQDALTNVDGSGDFFSWVDSPEGKAFEEARNKDWEEFGKTDYDLIPGYGRLIENAAQTCTLYWSAETRWSELGRYKKLEISAPHRFKWAAEWLPKR